MTHRKAQAPQGIRGGFSHRYGPLISTPDLRAPNLQLLRIGEGLLDEHLLSTVDAIGYSTDCVSDRPHGLAASVESQLPYVKFASPRQPGTVTCYRTNSDESPLVYALHAQHFSAGPTAQTTPSGPNDDETTRLRWMHSCLLTASHQLQSEFSDPLLALPWQLGCVFGGGTWNSYLALIMRVAVLQPTVTFLVVMRSNLLRPLHVQVLLPSPPMPTPTKQELPPKTPAAWPRMIRCAILHHGSAAGCITTKATSHVPHVQALLARLGVYVRPGDCLRLSCRLISTTRGEVFAAEYACNLSGVLFRRAIAQGLSLDSHSSADLNLLHLAEKRVSARPVLVLSACCRQ